jgi:hypothetical protein
VTTISSPSRARANQSLRCARSSVTATSMDANCTYCHLLRCTPQGQDVLAGGRAAVGGSPFARDADDDADHESCDDPLDTGPGPVVTTALVTCHRRSRVARRPPGRPRRRAALGC